MLKLQSLTERALRTKLIFKPGEKVEFSLLMHEINVLTN